jgi:hypothetical protein
MYDAVADRLQFEMQELRDRISVLELKQASVDNLSAHPEPEPVQEYRTRPEPEASVANLATQPALTSGNESLPHPSVENFSTQPEPEASSPNLGDQPAIEIPELDLSVGMTTGQRR